MLTTTSDSALLIPVMLVQVYDSHPGFPHREPRWVGPQTALVDRRNLSQVELIGSR